MALIFYTHTICKKLLIFFCTDKLVYTTIFIYKVFYAHVTNVIYKAI